jgi:hypothetical protein
MNFFYIIIGFSLVIFGVAIIIDPIFHDSKHKFIHDFTEIKWPFGVFLTLLGFIFLYVSFRKKSATGASNILICLGCRHLINKSDFSDKLCPKCGADLEELDGFYERHPELKKE